MLCPLKPKGEGWPLVLLGLQGRCSTVLGADAPLVLLGRRLATWEQFLKRHNCVQEAGALIVGRKLPPPPVPPSPNPLPPIPPPLPCPLRNPPLPPLYPPARYAPPIRFGLDVLNGQSHPSRPRINNKSSTLAQNGLVCSPPCVCTALCMHHLVRGPPKNDFSSLRSIDSSLCSTRGPAPAPH